MLSVIKFDDEHCQIDKVIAVLDLHRTSVQRLVLHRFLTDESLQMVLAFLFKRASVCHVHALNLASNPSLTGVSILRLADQASTLRLRELDLSNNPKAFTAESLAALERALSVLPMERLQLINCGLQRRDVCQGLERLIRNNNTIQWLNLSQNHLGARHIQTLATGFGQNKCIKHLDLSNNPMKDTGVKRLMIPTICESLESLSLRMTQFSYVGASHVMNCLLRNRSIQKIDLSQNNLSAESADNIGSILKHNYTLRELNISQGNIGNDGMQVIAQGLLDSDATQLTHLNIGSNGLTDATTIAEVIRKSILVELCLKDNAIREMAPLADAIHVDLSLKILDISQNHMEDPSCWTELIYHGSYTLTHFLYNHNHMDNVQAERLEAAIRFLQNEKTWLANILHRIEKRPRVSLDLTDYTYGDEEIVRIAQALEKHRPNVPRAFFSGVHDRAFCFLGRRVFKNWTAKITALHLHNCQHLGGDGWSDLTAAIADQICPLETLSIMHSHVRRPQTLETALLKNTSLKHLCLEDSGLGVVDAKAILSAALKHPTLGYLNLAHNKLTDEVLTGMAPIERLRTLRLHNNELTDVGALSIAQAVMHCNTITWLTLKDNHLTKKGIDALNIFLKMEYILDCNDYD